MMAATSGFEKHEMKAELYLRTAHYFKIDIDFFTLRARNREWKGVPWSLLKLAGSTEALSPRQALIHVSENVIKPQFGKDFFGLAAADKCVKEDCDFAVFSDAGFISEIAPLASIYQTLIIVRLYRDGFTFEGDSRSYLEGINNAYDIILQEGRPGDALETIKNIVEVNLLPWSKAS
jgi:hypothetical protein